MGIKSYLINGLFSDLLTSLRVGTRRIAVDPQQTSFEENSQFRFHCFFSDLWGADLASIPAGQQLVLKFTVTNPVDIIVRNPQVYLGGFVYRVFGDGAGVTFTGTLADFAGTEQPSKSNIFTVNGNLEDSGRDSHPQAGVTIQWAMGAGIFASTGKSPNGTVVTTDGNQNSSTNEYAPNDVKSGVARNQTFWLVMDSISNQLTKGMLTIAFEEKF